MTGQDHPLCLDAASRWNTYFQVLLLDTSFRLLFDGEFQCMLPKSRNLCGCIFDKQAHSHFSSVPCITHSVLNTACLPILFPEKGYSSCLLFAGIKMLTNAIGIDTLPSSLQDNEILEQITRDVVRTHPDMHFFTGESEASELHRQVPCSCSRCLSEALLTHSSTEISMPVCL